MDITRRQFLKFSGAGALGLAATPLFDQRALARYMSTEGGGEQVGLLVDTTRCIGCRSCEVACKKKNNLPADSAELMPYGKTFPERLSATTFTTVEFHDVARTNQYAMNQLAGGTASPELPRGSIRSAKKQCMHCVNPTCASVCPVGAIYKTPLGPVDYDADKCIGCRYCVAACPFNIPKFEWDSANPRIRKCNMCRDLVEAGQPTACSQACPAQALTYGKRTELIAEAQGRVGQNPGKYYPYIYGLSEVGGTSVLYLANVPFDELGFNTKLPKTELPDLTWQVMEKVPFVAIGMGLLMGTISWWTHRKVDERPTTIDEK